MKSEFFSYGIATKPIITNNMIRNKVLKVNIRQVPGHDIFKGL